MTTFKDMLFGLDSKEEEPNELSLYGVKFMINPFKRLLKKDEEEIQETPLSSEASELSSFFDDFELFKGGDREGWSRVVKLGEKWIQKALEDKIIKEEPTIKRIGQNDLEDAPTNFSIKGLNQSFPESMGALTESHLRRMADILIDQAVQNFDTSKFNTLGVEIEILKEGGFLIGTKDLHELWIYYPMKFEKMIDKLKPQEELSTTTMSGGFYGTASAMPIMGSGIMMSGGAGGGGINGYGGGGGGSSSYLIGSLSTFSSYSRGT